MTIFTIGHSTRSLDEFIALLKAHGVTQLADIRTIPKSKRHPHFAGEALAASLPVAGISYRHFPGLGGLRKPRRDSRNSGWKNDSFRGYADYMQTDEFANALKDLVRWSDAGSTGPGLRTVIMCAEAVWWRCHRQLVSDALVASGIDVRHISSATSAPLHSLTDFARVGPDGRVTYPGLL